MLLKSITNNIRLLTHLYFQTEKDENIDPNEPVWLSKIKNLLPHGWINPQEKLSAVRSNLHQLKKEDNSLIENAHKEISQLIQKAQELNYAA